MRGFFSVYRLTTCEFSALLPFLQSEGGSLKCIAPRSGRLAGLSYSVICIMRKAGLQADSGFLEIDALKMYISGPILIFWKLIA